MVHCTIDNARTALRLVLGLKWIKALRPAGIILVDSRNTILNSLTYRQIFGRYKNFLLPPTFCWEVYSAHPMSMSKLVVRNNRFGYQA